MFGLQAENEEPTASVAEASTLERKPAEEQPAGELGQKAIVRAHVDATSTVGCCDVGGGDMWGCGRL